MQMPRRDPPAHAEKLIPLVYAYAAYRLGDGPDADDATVDTIERAVRYRKKDDPSKGEPLACLIGIARNCIADLVAAREDVVDEPLPEGATDDLEEGTTRRLTLRLAVARLD